MRIKAGRLPRLPNLKNPTTFNEKILHLKLDFRQSGAHIYADKYAVRKFVADRIGEQYLIPLIGVFADADMIDFEALPFNSGYFMCIKLKDLDAEKVRQLLLEKYSTGVIALNDTLRIAFSSIAKDQIQELFDNIYKACSDLKENVKS